MFAIRKPYQRSWAYSAKYDARVETVDCDDLFVQHNANCYNNLIVQADLGVVNQVNARHLNASHNATIGGTLTVAGVPVLPTPAPVPITNLSRHNGFRQLLILTFPVAFPSALSYVLVASGGRDGDHVITHHNPGGNNYVLQIWNHRTNTELQWDGNWPLRVAVFETSTGHLKYFYAGNPNI